MPDIQDRPKDRPVEAPEPYRRTPEEMLWGWQENGKRMPGVMERIETAVKEIGDVKTQIAQIMATVKSFSWFKWVIVGSIWLDILVGHRGTAGDAILNNLLHTILPALSASAAPLIH